MLSKFCFHANNKNYHGILHSEYYLKLHLSLTLKGKFQNSCFYIVHLSKLPKPLENLYNCSKDAQRGFSYQRFSPSPLPEKQCASTNIFFINDYPPKKIPLA